MRWPGRMMESEEARTGHGLRAIGDATRFSVRARSFYVGASARRRNRVLSVAPKTQWRAVGTGVIGCHEALKLVACVVLGAASARARVRLGPRSALVRAPLQGCE